MSVRSSKIAGRDFQKVQHCLPFAVGCAVIAALSGCGNYVDAQAEGISAVSRVPDGGYSYHVYSCEGYNVTGISFAGGFYDGPSGSNNPPLGAFTKQEPSSGYSVVNLKEPEGWEESHPLNLPTESGKYIIAHFELDNTGAGLPSSTEHYIPQVDLTVGELQKVEPEVLVSGRFEQASFEYGSVEDFIREGQKRCG